MNRLRARLFDDTGTTLIEVLVGMAVMSIFLVIFTSSMYVMFGTANKVQAVAETSNQASTAFLQLDHEVRYASAISTPTFTANTWHVEFLTTVVSRTATTAQSSQRCTQLAVAPPTGAATHGTLKQRTWTIGDTHPSAWTALAADLTNYTSSSSPFPATTSIAGGNASSEMQQLTIRLVVAQSAPGTAVTKSQYTFTALNSSATSGGSSVCQQFPVGSA
jgi:type II secretory pathway pseudopilin PulG